jgi:hypothetical protein
MADKTPVDQVLRGIDRQAGERDESGCDAEEQAIFLDA